MLLALKVSKDLRVVLLNKKVAHKVPREHKVLLETPEVQLTREVQDLRAEVVRKIKVVLHLIRIVQVAVHQVVPARATEVMKVAVLIDKPQFLKADSFTTVSLFF
jgi:hypothetical protein